MKVNDFRGDVETTGLQEVGQFSILANRQMMKILSSGLYSNKPMAILRELGANAYDSHVSAKSTDKAFNVHLPSTMEPYFEIRDFGTGLSHEGIMKLYTTYGASTKDNSNKYVGEKGLGSKSPFSYVDSYTVTSYFEGEKRVYTAFIDENGMPTIALMGEAEPIDEANGLAVQLGVKREDFENWREYAQTIFRRYPVPPVVVGNPRYRIEPIKYVFEGKGWRMYAAGYQNNGGKAIQGTVAYPLDINGISNPTTATRAVLSLPIEIDFPIGEIETAASREHLSYDEITQTNIQAHCEEIFKEIPQRFQKHFDNCKTEWEAKCQFYKLFNSRADYGSTFSSWIQAGYMRIVWKGMVINNDTITIEFRKEDKVNKVKAFLPDTAIIRFDSYSLKQRRRYQASGGDDRDAEIECREKTVFFINDTKIGALARVQDYCTGISRSQGAAYLIVHDKDDVRGSDIAKLQKILIGAEFRLVSSLPKPVTAAKTGPKTKVFQLAERCSSSNPRDNWVETELDMDAGGFYVPTRRHVPQIEPKTRISDELEDFSSISDLRKLCVSFGFIDAKTPIYGIGPQQMGQVEKKGSWVNFFNTMKGKIENKIASEDIATHLAHYQNWKDWEASLYRKYYRSSMPKFMAVNPDLITDVDSTYRKMAELIEEVKGLSKSEDVRTAATLLRIDVSVGKVTKLDIQAMYEAVLTDYPMVRMVMKNSSEPSHQELMDIVNYVNMTDNEKV